MLHRLQCLLCGIIGMILAFLSTLVICIACLIVVSQIVIRRYGGGIGWDPISLAKNEPFIAGTLLLVFVSFLAWGFASSYRFCARRIAERKVA